MTSLFPRTGELPRMKNPGQRCAVIYTIHCGTQTDIMMLTFSCVREYKPCGLGYSQLTLILYRNMRLSDL